LLAGGEGFRLFPLTVDRAKPAVPFGGRYRIIDFWKYKKSSRMKRIFGTLILLVCGFSTPAFSQRYTLFPEFFTGDGWVCEIFFTNQGIGGVSGIEISFYDTNGLPASVDSNLGHADSYIFDVAAGATQVIRVNPEAAYVEGYAVITYPSNRSPIRATLVFRYVDAQGNVTVEAGVPQQEFGHHYSFPVEMNSSAGVHTALAVMNPKVDFSADQVMLFNLIGTDGSLQETARMLLGPGEHFAGYLDDERLFPGLDDFIGSISISSPFGMGILALRQDENAFGAISTDGGPILGPFALSGTAIGEQEPNNTFIQAQSISGSTLIAGTIETLGDTDFFKFIGQEHDVVSVICNTQQSGSGLDSFLEIRNSTFDLIAENNQNGLSPGLYPVDNSFIQVELPANDTYYIVVSDYWADGSPDYHYILHAKLETEMAPCTDSDGDDFDTCAPDMPGDDGNPKDCDDGNPAVFPGAAESCDGIDNNCDGIVDEGCSSIAAAGDSITVAYNADGIPNIFGQTYEQYEVSWALGISTRVNSLAQRLSEGDPEFSWDAVSDNYAFAGANIADLRGQVTRIVQNGPYDYVTIFIGHNDICDASTPEGMLDPATFETRFTRAMDILYSQDNPPDVVVSSLARVADLYAAGKDNSWCNYIWSLGRVCRVVTSGNAEYIAQADQRTRDYNEILESYADYYGYTYVSQIYDETFTLDDLSAFDCFHPNVSGQNRIANIIWLYGSYGE
jgi:lysophospholipase L1-like esterase